MRKEETRREKERERGRQAKQFLQGWREGNGETGMIKTTVIYGKVCRPSSRSLRVLTFVLHRTHLETCDPPHPTHMNRHTHAKNEVGF